MRIYAIDPACDESALVVFELHGGDRIHIVSAQILPNLVLRDLLYDMLHPHLSILVVEQIAGMGMIVGASTFETAYWSGRLVEAWTHNPNPFVRIKRHTVKMHLCGTMQSNDSTIRKALIARFGDVGTKNKPGPLFGIKADLWQALAVGVTWADMHPRALR